MKLHQILITEDKQLPKDLPPITEYCYDNIRNLYNEYDYHLYSGEELEDIIKNNFDKDIFIAYQKLKPFACKADLARACLLYLYGGLYIDLHVFFLFPLETNNLIKYDFYAFRDMSIASMHTFSVQNGIMFSKSKSMVMEKTIEIIVSNCKKEYYGIQPISVSSCVSLGKALHSLSEVKNSYALIGELRKLTDKNLGFVMDDETLLALRFNFENDIRKTGLKGVNHYPEMWRNKDVYDQTIKF